MNPAAWQLRLASERCNALLRRALFFSSLMGLLALVGPQAFAAIGAKSRNGPPFVVWNENLAGCTFSRTDDGKYQYGLWSGDVGVVLSVDAREVQIIRHRIEPIFGVHLTIRYRGTGGLNMSPDPTTLQFMKHFKIVQTSLDPDDYTEKIQADADALDDETRRVTAKHPEEKQV